MPYSDGINEEKILLIVCVIIMSFLLITFLYLYMIAPFMEARRNIKTEMKRTYGREHVYWKKQLKMLYLESIPIIGRFFMK